MKINYINDKTSDTSCCLINSSSRILIIGTSGSGKTSFAELICKKHNLHNIELDSLFWKENWIESGNEEFRNMIKEEMRDKTGYVINGNYNKVKDITWGNCDTIIWLDYSRFIVMYRVIKRTFIRVFTKKILWQGNIETFKKSFLSKDSIIIWAWKTYSIRKRQYLNLLNTNPYNNNQFIVIRNPRMIYKLII